jgi:hypothetical protein
MGGVERRGWPDMREGLKRVYKGRKGRRIQKGEERREGVD